MMARYVPDPPPIAVDDPPSGPMIRWHCEPPEPGEWYCPVEYEMNSTPTGPAALGIVDIRSWRPAWQRRTP